MSQDLALVRETRPGPPGPFRWRTGEVKDLISASQPHPIPCEHLGDVDQPACLLLRLRSFNRLSWQRLRSPPPCARGSALETLAALAGAPDPADDGGAGFPGVFGSFFGGIIPPFMCICLDLTLYCCLSRSPGTFARVRLFNILHQGVELRPAKKGTLQDRYALAPFPIL